MQESVKEATPPVEIQKNIINIPFKIKKIVKEYRKVSKNGNRQYHC